MEVSIDKRYTNTVNNLLFNSFIILFDIFMNNLNYYH